MLLLCRALVVRRIHPQQQTHARRDCASGFSYVNDVVLAMLTLLRKYVFLPTELFNSDDPRQTTTRNERNLGLGDLGRDPPEIAPRFTRGCSEMTRRLLRDESPRAP